VHSRQIERQKFTLRIPAIAGTLSACASLMLEICNLFNQFQLQCPIDIDEKKIQHILSVLKHEAPIGKNTLPMIRAAQSLDIPWHRVFGNLYQFGQGRRSRLFDSSISDQTPFIAVTLAQNKLQTSALLRAQGMPTPVNRHIRHAEDAIRFAEENGYPVVIKPSDCDRGLGVGCCLETVTQIIDAYANAKKHSDSIMVEKFIEGKDHRIHVFQGRAYRVRHRTPGGVIGDGKSTVEALLAILNADPNRGLPDSNSRLVKITLDEDANTQLARQGLNLRSIPTSGEYVQLRAIANVSSGGISEEVPIEEVHPDNLFLAERAVNTLKLDLAAVDFLIPDIRKSWLDIGGGICEINAKPQFGEDAPAMIFKRIFADRGRIPIIAILSDQHDNSWINPLRTKISEQDIQLGYLSPDGTWIGQQRIAKGVENGAYTQASCLLRDTNVEAILMHADQSISKNGSPCDRIDLLVIDSSLNQQAEVQLASLLAQISQSVLQIDHKEKAIYALQNIEQSIIQIATYEEISNTILGLICRPNAQHHD
jgi:cyanophycin synthetase